MIPLIFFALVAFPGSHPEQFPFGRGEIYDSDTILKRNRIPKTLAVVGAVVIGAEYGCTFRALGAEVHILDGRNVVGRATYQENARGRIVGDQDGFLKLIFHRDDLKLLGVHLMGELATEVVHIGLVAMMCNATGSLFIDACFNLPTLGLLYKTATLNALGLNSISPGSPKG